MDNTLMMMMMMMMCSDIDSIQDEVPEKLGPLSAHWDRMPCVTRFKHRSKLQGMQAAKHTFIVLHQDRSLAQVLQLDSASGWHDVVVVIHG
jgi:hypothetical protein